MRVADFNFELPDNLIARYPLQNRTASRLLVLDGTSGQIKHKYFADLLSYLNAGDLMVFNNTKVIAARLFGQKETGGKVEVLVERLLDTYKVLAHVKASKAPKEDTLIIFNEQIQATMLARHGSLFELIFNQPVLEVLEQIGHVPLPPYIDRSLDEVLPVRRCNIIL